MVDYAAEIDRIAAEGRRRRALLIEEQAEIQRETARRGQGCREWAAAEAQRDEERERANAARSGASTEPDRTGTPDQAAGTPAAGRSSANSAPWSAVRPGEAPGPESSATVAREANTAVPSGPDRAARHRRPEEIRSATGVEDVTRWRPAPAGDTNNAAAVGDSRAIDDRDELAQRQQEQAELRAAIARSAAVRKAGEFVAPTDVEDDSDDPYYDRRSWLI